MERLGSPCRMDWIQAALVEEFAASGTDAYRIADGEECRIERFGDGVIISHAADVLPANILEELSQWLERTGLRIRRIYARQLVISPGKRDAPRPIGRSSCEHTCTIHEAGLRYEVDFLAGYSCGLFLDQRANREVLRASERGSPPQPFCLHVFVFCRWSCCRNENSEH